MATILSSKPVKRRSCLGMSSGSKLPSRSRGTSMRSGPSSVSTVLALAAVAVVGRLVGLVATGRIAQVVAQLAAQRALDQRLLERHRDVLDCLGVIGPWTQLVKHLLRNLRQRRRLGGNGRSSFALVLLGIHAPVSSCYASHTKFRTGSLPLLRAGRQDQPRGHPGPCLVPVPLQQGRAGVDGQDFAAVEAYGVQRWLGQLGEQTAVDRTLTSHPHPPRLEYRQFEANASPKIAAMSWRSPSSRTTSRWSARSK